MDLPTFAGSRIAPAHFVLGGLRSQSLRRGIVWAVVPMLADDINSGVWTFVRCGRELVRGVSNGVAGGVVLGGEACGIALKSVGAGLGFAGSPLPAQPPLSVFSFLVNRGVGNNIETLVGNNGGWTFQFSYGSRQLGLTRWGIADHPTTTLGAVPNGGVQNCVGLAHDGTTARFFLNGRFENIAAGGYGAGTGTDMLHRGLAAPVENVSVHVLYVWNRVVSDGEFFTLMQDPWSLVRGAEVPWAMAVAGGGGASGRRVFVPAFIG
jgi:hypothetical protein